MNNKLIILLLLAMMLVGTSLCETTRIPASQDVYIGLGTENGLVVNQTDVLRCEVNVTDVNGTKLSSYPGVPMIQFNISSLNITDDDIGILVLKASSIEKQNDDSALFALLSIGSEWNEESDYTAFLINILPAWNIIKKNDLTLMSINTDGDGTLAFDVSEKLKQAKAKGDSISFLLEAISNSSYKADFLSREGGQGPYLMVMPYPSQFASNPKPLLNNSSEPSLSLDKKNITDRKAKTMADLQKIESANKNIIQNPILSLKESMKQTADLPSAEKMELKT
ncbi:MAG: hypothetical protein NTW84_02065 [Methanothrix sp.]|nr:hypothetical protein [Methanothrix sp.]